MVVSELARRKLIKMVMELEGPELMTLISREGRRSRVLEHLPDCKNCIVPDDCSEHAWFVEWLAGPFTGKHLHTLRSMPDLRTVRYDLSSFVNKIKWRSVLDNGDNDLGQIV